MIKCLVKESHIYPGLFCKKTRRIIERSWCLRKHQLVAYPTSMIYFQNKRFICVFIQTAVANAQPLTRIRTYCLFFYCFSLSLSLARALSLSLSLSLFLSLSLVDSKYKVSIKSLDNDVYFNYDRLWSARSACRCCASLSQRRVAIPSAGTNVPVVCACTRVCVRVCVCVCVSLCCGSLSHHHMATLLCRNVFACACARTYVCVCVCVAAV